MPNMFFAIQLAIKVLKAATKKSCTIESEEGIITLEYGLLGVLIAVALIGSIQTLRDKVFDMLTTITNAFP